MGLRMVKPSVGQVIYVNTAGRETKSKAFPEVVYPAGSGF